MATFDDRDDRSSDDPGTAVAETRELLYDGQQLDQPSFHELYLRTSKNFRAELIGGVVHVMSSPVHPRHARPFIDMAWFLKSYGIATPVTIILGDATTELGPRNEVQPDCALLINPIFGGQTGADESGYTTGCPEMVVEIASSTLQIDLNAKKKLYESANALEYVILDEPHRRFHWFVTRDGRFELLAIDPDGIYRSRAFPGLWLDASAFLGGDDGQAVMDALNRGLASREHADFVERLRQYRANRP